MKSRKKPDADTLRDAIDAMRRAAEYHDKKGYAEGLSDLEYAWADIYQEALRLTADWLETQVPADKEPHKPRGAAELQEFISERFTEPLRDASKLGVACIVIGATEKTSDRALLSSTTIEATASLLESAATTYRDATRVRVKRVGQA